MTKEDILNCVPENMEAGSWLHGYTTAIEHSRNSEESFRREAAKDILCAMIQAGVDDAWRNVVPAAIEGADELIKRLKGEEI